MNETLLPYMYLLGPAVFNMLYLAIRIYNKKKGESVHVGDYGFSIMRNVELFNASLDGKNKKAARIAINAVLIFSLALPVFVFIGSKIL